MSLKLNSFPVEHLKVANDGQKVGNISRSDLVATGRLLTLEYNGRATNSIHNNQEYEPKLDNIAYANLSAGYRKNLLMFCATGLSLRTPAGGPPGRPASTICMTIQSP